VLNSQVLGPFKGLFDLWFNELQSFWEFVER
jgi:hypothetical protein